MGGHEQQFIQQAFDANWVVPLGINVDGIEKDLETFLNHQGLAGQVRNNTTLAGFGVGYSWGGVELKKKK